MAENKIIGKEITNPRDNTSKDKSANSHKNSDDEEGLNNEDQDEIHTGQYILKYKYKNGIHAKFVYLLEHPITGHKLIKKRYRQEHFDIFVNEILHLEKLRDCPFTPTLYKVRPEKLTIYMSYCGKPIPEARLPFYKDTIKEYKEKLRTKWKVHHNDLKPGNICLLDKQVYFIDFGWAARKKLKAGYGIGRAGGI